MSVARQSYVIGWEDSLRKHSLAVERIHRQLAAGPVHGEELTQLAIEVGVLQRTVAAFDKEIHRRVHFKGDRP